MDEGGLLDRCGEFAWIIRSMWVLCVDYMDEGIAWIILDRCGGFAWMIIFDRCGFCMDYLIDVDFAWVILYRCGGFAWMNIYIRSLRGFQG